MKPTVFNYQEYEKVVEENKKLKAEVANLLIRCRIAEADRPKWIPTGERLPIPPTFCLVTTDGSHGDVIDIALYMSDGWHKASDVIAWMPLPPVYQGE